MQVPWRGKKGIWGEGGGIYRESEGVPRSFSNQGFVCDVRFRSLVGFMKESWYDIIILWLLLSMYSTMDAIGDVLA